MTESNKLIGAIMHGKRHPVRNGQIRATPEFEKEFNTFLDAEPGRREEYEKAVIAFSGEFID